MAIKYSCENCGGTNLLWDATAVWDTENQMFTLSDDALKNGTCEDCGAGDLLISTEEEGA